MRVGARGKGHVPYFIFGALSGCILTLLTTSHLMQTKTLPNAQNFVMPKAENVPIEKVLNGEGKEENSEDNGSDEGLGPLARHKHDDESALSMLMYNNVRVYCWIMTSKNNTLKKAIHVNATWGPRCNKLVFITSEKSSGLPIVELNIKEGRKFLWQKTKEAFKHIYNNELKDYDWFLKADDDTFVILENLRFMLLAYSPDDPIYFGCKFKPFAKQGYMSGGAGYVLSREAVKRFVEDALTDGHKCKESNTGAEDAELGKCLQNVGVIAGDSRDAKGRHRMLPFGPASHFGYNKTLPKWFYKYMYYPYEQGKECCSDYMISYHYVNTATMYSLDFLVYHLRPFGLLIGENVNNGDEKLDDKGLLEYAKKKSLENTKPAEPPVAVEEAEAVELKEREMQIRANEAALSGNGTESR